MRYESDNYYSDHRVQASNRWYESIDEKKMTAKVVVYFVDEKNGDYEETIDLPVIFGVCPTCNGKGTHINPSIDCNGLTAEDFAEDPDFADEYLSGSYDMTCNGCDGKRVVPILHRDTIDPIVLKAIDDAINADYDFKLEQAAERRMGA